MKFIADLHIEHVGEAASLQRIDNGRIGNIRIGAVGIDGGGDDGAVGHRDGDR